MSRRSHFIETIEDATDNGIITDDEEVRLLATDMVLRARRIADGSRLWIAAEASGVLHSDDIERAARPPSLYRKSTVKTPCP